MAGKKINRFNKQLRVFVVSLLIVLATGGGAMALFFAVSSGRAGKVESQIIDFNWFAGQTGVNSQPGAGNTEGIYSAPEMGNAYDETSSANEQLYQAAVANGENVRLVDCADNERVTLAFAGDILFDDEYAMMFSYRNRGSDINSIFSSALLERMRGADVFMLNNEFSFSERGTPTEGKTFTFRANPGNVSLYDQMGVDIVSLANNHAYDYGNDALLDTFATLENAGIPYVGAGRNIDEAKKPLYLIANGMKIGVVSATQIERNGSPDTKEATATSAGVLRCMDPAALLESIAVAKENSDFVILYIHWGTEGQEQTDWLQDKQATVYAEAGVDLIIGDHPHCLQKIDMISGVPVVYSLGNFWFNSKTQNTCIVEIGINKGGLEYLRFIPCKQEDCRTRELEGAEKDGVLNYMRGLSTNIQIDDEGYLFFG